MFMKTVYIYLLKDQNNNIRYVGKTNNIKKRLSAHISESLKNKGRRYVLNWIFNLLENNQKPIIEIIEECNIHNWEERERFWISFYKKIIPNLCNNADGGLGGSGVKNYTENEIEIRRKAMSRLMSKFSEEDKIIIWNSIQNNMEFKDINKLYSNYTRQMDFGVRNGRQWRHITGILKIEIKPKRKGYTYNHGRYIVRENVNGKKKIKFSSKNENDVLNYLSNYNQVAER